VNSFDSGKGRLATYACRCIDNELLMMLRSRKKLSREVSLYEPIGQDKEGNAIHLLDVIEEKQKDVVEDLELDRNIRRLFLALDHCLTEREYRIVVMRYGILGCKEHTQQEVGDVLGISRSYVSRMEKRALHKLAEALRED
jgi:RNA polymerase sigma factor, sigma-70 family